MTIHKKSVFLFLVVFIFTGAITEAGTLTPTYGSSIVPGGSEGGSGLGTLKSGASSVTVSPASILAVSDSDKTVSSGIITWTASVPMTVTVTFTYQISAPGCTVVWQADWFGGMLEYTDGKEKTFSETFDIADPVFVSAKAKNGSVSISKISVQQTS